MNKSLVQSTKLKKVLMHARNVRAQHGIPIVRQFVELSYLFLTRRFGPQLYYMLSLWRPELTMADKRAFFNPVEYYEWIHRANPERYSVFGLNKLAEKALLSLLRIPTGTFVGFYKSIGGRDCEGNALCNTSQLQALLASRVGTKLCIKDPESAQGNRILFAHLIQKDDEQVIVDTLISGVPPVPLRGFIANDLEPDRHKGWLIEEYVQQHDMLAALHPNSLNTLRLVLLKSESRVEVLTAILRLGRSGSPVDNISQGGLLAEIDIETGFTTCLRTGADVPEYLERHPDTGAEVVGIEIPHWAQAVELSKATLEAVPGLRYAGIDIAVTQLGALVIEINSEPDFVSTRNFAVPSSRILQ